LVPEAPSFENLAWVAAAVVLVVVALVVLAAVVYNLFSA